MVARKAVKTEETLFDQIKREVPAPSDLKVTEDIVLKCPTKRQFEASQAPGLDEDESNRILLGAENFDALDELFGEEAPHMWAEFQKRYIAHFFPSQNEQ